MTVAMRATLALFLAGAFVLLWGVLNARADPVVRRAALAMPDWPAGAPPVTVALISDIHLSSASMNLARLSRIVAQVNALRPDAVLIAGDFVDGADPDRGARDAARLVAPLSRLRAPLGVIATFGNHDHWTSVRAVRAALRLAGVTALANDAVQRGPLVIVGIDDSATAHFDIDRSVAAARRLTGARVTLSHDPHLAAYLPGDLTLMMGGHSHCGQIVLPWIGPVAKARLFDPHYRCGIVRDPGRTTFVTAGLGTSVLPIRYGAPPDLWLVRLGP